MEKLNVVISQRLRLASEDLKKGKMNVDELLKRILSQGLELTLLEAEERKTYVKNLFDQTRSWMKDFKSANYDVLTAKLNNENSSINSLRELTGCLADMVLILDVGISIPETTRYELELVAKDGVNCSLKDQRMLTLLTFCMTELGKQKLAQHNLPEIPKTLSREEQEKVLKTVAQLRSEGKLTNHLKRMPDELIAQFLADETVDTVLDMSESECAIHMIDLLMNDVLNKLAIDKRTQEHFVLEKSETDLQSRHLLAIASMLNMKETKKLPREMQTLSDEQLAIVAYAATDLNYYYDEAAAGRLTTRSLIAAVAVLLMAALISWIAIEVVCVGSMVVTTSIVFDCILTLIVILITPLSVICFDLEILSEVTDLVVTELVPYGLDETRLGIKAEATIKKLKRKVTDRDMIKTR